MPGILIGVDGSDGAERALQWAAREADLHGWELTALLGWGFLSQHHADPEAGFDPDYTFHDADERCSRGATWSGRSAPSVASGSSAARSARLPAVALLDPAPSPTSSSSAPGASARSRAPSWAR